MWLVIVFVLIIIFCLGLMLYLFLQKKKRKSNFSVKSVLPQKTIPQKKVIQTPATEEIEILDVFADDKELKEDDGSINLDDLFKTISMTAINDENFDFGLRRSNK